MSNLLCQLSIPATAGVRCHAVVDAHLESGADIDEDGIDDAFELLNEVSEHVRTGKAANARQCPVSLQAPALILPEPHIGSRQSHRLCCDSAKTAQRTFEHGCPLFSSLPVAACYTF